MYCFISFILFFWQLFETSNWFSVFYSSIVRQKPVRRWKSYVHFSLKSLPNRLFPVSTVGGEGLPKLCVEYPGDLNSPALVLEIDVFISFYQWMKTGWKESAKGRLAFSPKRLLRNMQLQIWKALLEESRMFQNLQSGRKVTIITQGLAHTCSTL